MKLAMKELAEARCWLRIIGESGYLQPERLAPLIEESREPELADRYDYYAVPSCYVGGEKLFEAHIGMSYEDIKREVKRVLEAALA